MASQEYPYTPAITRLEELFDKIPNLGLPEKLTKDWLKGLGYTSSNDRQSLAAMRRLGMIGTASKPTDLYRAVRSKDRKTVAEGIKSAYRELFDLYPDAERKDSEALQNFFRSKVSAGEQVQRLMVRTFLVFCKYGDFGQAAEVPRVPTPETAPKKASKSNGSRSGGPSLVQGGGLTLNVNIQLQLPASADGDVYDKLFAAMGKHLKGLAHLE